MQNFDRYGRVSLDHNECGTIQAFHEKEFCKEGLINGGVYCVETAASFWDEQPEKFSFEKNILEPQCSKSNLFGIVQDVYFIDIGIPEDYSRAQSELVICSQ